MTAKTISFVDATTRQPLRGLDYTWRDTGPAQAPVIVLLHGLMDTGAGFAPLVEALHRQLPVMHRFIAPDWRGHGATAWAAQGDYWFPQYLADLDALLETTVGTAPVTLIGHSMGGQVASLYAGVRPERVSKLITLDSLNVPDSDTAKAGKRYTQWLDAQASSPEPRVYDSPAVLAERLAQRYPELTDTQRAFLVDHWAEPVDGGPRCRMRMDPWHRVSFPYGFRASEAYAIWQTVKAPVLCIDGGASPAKWFTPEDEMAQRHACFSSLQRVVLEDCGHMLHLQAPDEVAAEICAFIE